MNKLYCYSHKEFRRKMETEAWNDDNIPENAAFICIGCTPDCQEYVGSTFGLFDRFDFEQEHSNVLKVRFDDIDCETRDFPDAVFDDRVHTVRGMTDEQAGEVVKFIAGNIGKDFYIHCNAGKSRSQAVVRYILDVYKDNEWEVNPQNPPGTVWNSYVYRKLVEATSD